MSKPANKQKTVVIGQILSSKQNKTYIKPKCDKFGIKSLTVELNDGTIVDLSDKALFLRDPVENIKFLVSKGFITPEEGEKKIEGIPSFIKSEIIFSLE